MKTAKMTCPNCGASLTVPTDIDRLNCTNCGTELALIQGEGYISLKTIEHRAHTTSEKSAGEKQHVEQGKPATASNQVDRLTQELRKARSELSQIQREKHSKKGKSSKQLRKQETDLKWRIYSLENELRKKGASTAKKKPPRKILLWGIIGVIVACAVLFSMIPSSPDDSNDSNEMALGSEREATAAQVGDANIPAVTDTPVWTATQTSTRTATPTLTLTPSPTPIEGEVQSATLNLRAGPGQEYPRIGFVEQGEIINILAQNEDGSWVFVHTSDQSEGWVFCDYVETATSLDALEISDKVIPTPTTTPTATKTSTPRPTNTPTPSYKDTPPEGTRCEQNSTRGVCVGNFEYKKYLGYSAASSNNRFIVFGILVKNVDAYSISASPLDVTLVMENGSTYGYSSETFYYSNPFESITIAPDDNSQGAIVFLVPNNVGPRRVIYRGGLFESDIVIDLRSPPSD
jgi:uncharacterized protein YraI